MFFHLPALHDPRQTVFGISCYRQIDADKVSAFFLVLLLRSHGHNPVVIECENLTPTMGYWVK